MATKLIRGMGSFFKTCSCKRQGGRAHPYAIRFRNGAGRQCEESGYPTQDDVLDRLTQMGRRLEPPQGSAPLWPVRARIPRRPDHA